MSSIMEGFFPNALEVVVSGGSSLFASWCECAHGFGQTGKYRKIRCGSVRSFHTYSLNVSIELRSSVSDL